MAKTTILGIVSSDIEVCITLPKHPDLHEFLYEVLEELGIRYRPIVDEGGGDITPREIVDEYALYEGDASSVSMIWGKDVAFMLVRPSDRDAFSRFLSAHTTMHAP